MRQHNSHIIHEVMQSASEILRLGREIVNYGHMERKFIVFPIFMAGFVEKRPAERAEIMSLLRKLEEDSIGRNFVATRQLLEIVYERQERSQQQQQPSGWDLGVRQSPEQRRRSTGQYAQHGNPDWLSWDYDGAGDVDWVGMISELGLQVVNCRM